MKYLHQTATAKIDHKIRSFVGVGYFCSGLLFKWYFVAMVYCHKCNCYGCNWQTSFVRLIEDFYYNRIFNANFLQQIKRNVQLVLQSKFAIVMAVYYQGWSTVGVVYCQSGLMWLVMAFIEAGSIIRTMKTNYIGSPKCSIHQQSSMALLG